MYLDGMVRTISHFDVTRPSDRPPVTEAELFYQPALAKEL
jgi:hypothetical protein